MPNPVRSYEGLRRHEHHLRLIAFIVYQYLSVGDSLVLTFRHAVTSILNDCEQKLKENQFANRYVTTQLVRNDTHIDTLAQIEHMIDRPEIDDS